ncbi:MAG: hypothetical protein OXH92_16070 [Bryobacterales bacterium]|nr:hypothetical protein [Gammaproteobacteria bacterium]MDE0435523.1 hypothetical protein [Bryobacterales bacterium]
MNYPDDIAELESLLERVLGMVEQDEGAVVGSERPNVDLLFLSSTKKLRSDLQKRLRFAKAERAHEVVRLTLHGAHLGTGTLPLRVLANFVTPLNAVLEQSAWRFWDRAGDVSRIDQKFIRHLDLRLAGMELGSTELVILGNTSPDLSGVSALESALRDVFELLESDIEAFADRVHAIGISAGKSLGAFLTRLESEHAAVELAWRAPDKTYRWDGRPTEVTRVRALLDEIGEPETTTEQFLGTVNVLSIRNRIEIERRDTGERLRVGYHKSVADLVHDLRLGDTRTFEVEKTIYPFVASKRKRDTYRLRKVMNRPQQVEPTEDVARP